MSRDKLKDDEEVDDFVQLFSDITKSTVLQGCKKFNDLKFVKGKPNEVCSLLTQLLYLLAQGETFNPSEMTDIFFGTTQLFQSQHPQMRRLMYLFIKEVAETTAADEVIIVTSSLQKDMVSSNDLLKANALRVLCKILDTAMLAQVDRSIKPLIVDRNPMVSSAALVSGHLLMADSPEIVKRWVGEVQEAMLSENAMVQYHALALLYRCRVHDRLAITKLVSGLWRGSKRVRSPMALCQLIRYTSTILKQSNTSEELSRAAYGFLESCVRHRDDMVIFEAARAIINLPDVGPQELEPAISQLQLFLSSGKPVLRFAAVRSLSKIAMKHPDAVTRCNDDMEAMISDSNRSIATLAITTLLKTGREDSVERLLKQIESFMTEIGTSMKVVVIKAIRQLCMRYPRKSGILLQFMHNCLRDEGEFAYKQALVNTILDLMDKLDGMKTAGLNALGEFIEDCEFPQLSKQVLHVLGTEAPSTGTPGRYIRYIFNRVILEVPSVRAAAVSALAKLAARVASLRPQIMVLLDRCQLDDDDEVRDRATMYVKILAKQMAMDSVAETGVAANNNEMGLITDGLPEGVSVRGLEDAIVAYQMLPVTKAPITLETLPIVLGTPEHEQTTDDNDADAIIEDMDNDEDDMQDGGVGSVQASMASDNYAAELYQIPELQDVGKLIKTIGPIALSEDESEYNVQCLKHIFPNGTMVLQFNVVNTIDSQLLRECKIELEFEEPDAWDVTATVPAPQVTFQTPGKTYVRCQANPDLGLECYQASAISAELLFFQCECDPSTGEILDEDDEGLDDQYPIESIELNPGDFIGRTIVNNFRETWKTLDVEEKVETFELDTFEDIQAAVPKIIDILGMTPCDGTSAVAPRAKKHMILLAGTFSTGGEIVLARASLQQTNAESGGVRMKIGIRCNEEDISELVMSCIA
jgi:coatomer protein complex subunit gamma